MGNRAVITACRDENVKESKEIGIYLHWNGGYDSVNAFLTYCKFRGFRKPNEDTYGWARLCQVIANFFGGDLSIGIGQCCNLDCDNWDNGVYVIDGWDIVDRKYFSGCEQQEYDLAKLLVDIDKLQPENDRLGEAKIYELLNKYGVS